jgi:hypothetical protein
MVRRDPITRVLLDNSVCGASRPPRNRNSVSSKFRAVTCDRTVKNVFERNSEAGCRDRELRGEGAVTILPRHEVQAIRIGYLVQEPGRG